MSATILIVLVRTLWRDRVGLMMTFILPAVIFMVFAEIFSATGQGEPDPNVGVVRLANNDLMDRVIASVSVGQRQDFPSEPALLLALNSGIVDVGLVVDGDTTPGVRVLTDPARPLAGVVLQRQLSENLATVAPSIYFDRERAVWTALVGDLTDMQSLRLDAFLRGERQVTLPPPLVLSETGSTPDGVDPAVSYYTGAIGIMFIFFSAMNGASGLIDERNSGMFDRYLSFGKGIGFALRGRGYFLILQGTLQMLVVFAVASWMYDVNWLAVLVPWSIITLATAACVASLAICLASLCRTRAQMQTLSTFAVLVMSALGGSMVPLYLMPEWLRWAGRLTPTAWSIELFDGVITRALALSELSTQLALLCAVAALAFAAAVVHTSRKLLP